MRPLLLAALALATATCVSPVDPDQGHYACTLDPDCGSGWECKAQFSGGSLCFKLGVCQATERCNGLDDTCDGRADEGFDLATDSANCGACGHACAAGTACADAGCVEAACADGLDNDLNGQTDCADLACDGQRCDADAGPRRCGLRLLDGGVPDGGTDAGVRGCYLP